MFWCEVVLGFAEMMSSINIHEIFLSSSSYLWFLQVQADQYVSTEDLQVEMGQLDKHLEALEQKGVELERNLRDCKNGESNSFCWVKILQNLNDYELNSA